MGTAPDLPAFFNLVHVEVTDSTNEDARRQAMAGATAGTLVWADRQDGGRGRRGRSWISPAGNLYCSIVLRPTQPIIEALQAGFIASLAAAEAIESLLPASARVQCKWPNDVLINGRKAVGLLLESQAEGDRLAWLVVGIGINVASHPPAEECLYPPTSLAAEGGEATTVVEMLSRFGGAFRLWHRCWEEDGFMPVREAWMRRAYRLGDVIEARLETHSLIGRFVDLDDVGALILDDGLRRHVIMAADIFPSGPPTRA